MPKYSWPVGATREEREASKLPERWIVSNPFANSYWLGTHTGVDLDLPSNEDARMPVYAVADGTVVYAERVFKADGKPSTWGNLTVISHEDGSWCSRYGHQDGILVQKGDKVVAGQEIGRIGRTGGDAGSTKFSEHLHFDISGPICATYSSAPYWPKTKEDALRHFRDPIAFLEQKLAPEVEVTTPFTYTVLAEAGLRVRSGPAGTIVGRMVKGTRFTADLSTATNRSLEGVPYEWVQIVWAENAALMGGWVANSPSLIGAASPNPTEIETLTVLVASLNVRSEPIVKTTTLLPPPLRAGERVRVTGRTVTDDYIWRRLVDRAGLVASEVLRTGEKYLGVAAPPQQPRRLAGFHCVQSGLPASDVERLAALDRSLTWVINNDWELANRLAALGCKKVIFRLVDTAYDPFPILTGNVDEDRNRGYDYFFNSSTAARNRWQVYKNLHPDVWLQYINEWQHPNDGPFTEGLIMAADTVNRRLVNFNDAVGNPHLWREAISPATGQVLRTDDNSLPQNLKDYAEKNGKWRSPGWEQRREALRLHIQWPDGRIRTRPHAVGYHAYGASPNRKMVNAADWPWYAGRWAGLYETTPYRPPIFFTECGPFNAVNPGVEHVMDDIATFERALFPFTEPLGFAYWTLGVWSVTGSGMNDVIPAFEAWLKGAR